MIGNQRHFFSQELAFKFVQQAAVDCFIHNVAMSSETE